MRIAFDASSLAAPVLRGWDRYTVGLVAALQKKGAKITLLHPSAKPLHAAHVAHLACETRAINVPDHRYSWLYWEQVALPFALRSGKYDIYHAPAERGIPLLSPTPSVLTLHSATGPSYASLVDRGLLPGPVRNYIGVDYDPRRRSRFEYYWRAQVASAKHIIVPSEFARGEVIHFYNVRPDRVTTTLLAAHEQFRRPRSSEASIKSTLARFGLTKPYLLFVGGYEPHKNIPGLLEAFAHVRRRRPDLKLVLVGSSTPSRDLLRVADELKLDQGTDVRFLSAITDELTDVYDAAELLVTLSWRETFCLPALEAIARGKCVVASAWGAAREVVGTTGRLVDPRDTASAADAILDMLDCSTDPLIGAELQQQAQRFRWELTADRTLEVYSRLL